MVRLLVRAPAVGRHTVAAVRPRIARTSPWPISPVAGGQAVTSPSHRIPRRPAAGDATEAEDPADAAGAGRTAVAEPSDGVLAEVQLASSPTVAAAAAQATARVQSIMLNTRLSPTPSECVGTTARSDSRFPS